VKSLDHLVKSPQDIAGIRRASQLAAEVLAMIEPHVIAGTSTATLDRICHQHITESQQAIPAPLNYKGFPKSICTSVNHVVCHGIPCEKKILKNGDIINIDVTVIKDGYYGDTSKMFVVGNTSRLAERVITTAQVCLYEAIKLVKPGQSLKTIGRAIEKIALQEQFSSVHEYCGHGIGLDFHENDLQILHYDDQSIPDQVLLPGLTFTIEPMINTGTRHTKTLSDNWTVVTRDRGLSAQWEHTLLVTNTGCEILTHRPDDSIPAIIG